MFAAREADCFGYLLADGLSNEPTLMESQVHPFWCKSEADGTARWLAEKQRMDWALGVFWTRIGIVIQAHSSLPSIDATRGSPDKDGAGF